MLRIGKQSIIISIRVISIAPIEVSDVTNW